MGQLWKVETAEELRPSHPHHAHRSGLSHQGSTQLQHPPQRKTNLIKEGRGENVAVEKRWRAPTDAQTPGSSTPTPMSPLLGAGVKTVAKRGEGGANSKAPPRERAPVPPVEVEAVEEILHPTK